MLKKSLLNIAFQEFYYQKSYAPTHFALNPFVHRHLKVRKMPNYPTHYLRNLRTAAHSKYSISLSA